jgi:hypothetical protein
VLAQTIIPTASLLGAKPVAEVFGGVYAYAEFWMPWPMKNRGMLCDSAFYDCLDDPLGAYIAFVGSFTKDDDDDDNDDDNQGEKDATSRGAQTPAAEAALRAARAGVPTTNEQCPRMGFESYTMVTPLPPLDKNDGAMRSRWTFYFDRTDYQMEVPNFVLGFLMKVCAPFVRTIATGLAKNVPSAYKERMAEDEAFYGVFGRRCLQHVQSQLIRQQQQQPSKPHRRHTGMSLNGRVMRRPSAKAPLKRARGLYDVPGRGSTKQSEVTWDTLKKDMFLLSQLTDSGEGNRDEQRTAIAKKNSARDR